MVETWARLEERRELAYRRARALVYDRPSVPDSPSREQREALAELADAEAAVHRFREQSRAGLHDDRCARGDES